MPIFRSRRQAELLTMLFLQPDLEVTLTDLARRLDTTAGALHAEVDRLVEAGLLADRTIGRSRLLRANDEARAARPIEHPPSLLTIVVPSRRKSMNRDHDPRTGVCCEQSGVCCIKSQAPGLLPTFRSPHIVLRVTPVY